MKRIFLDANVVNDLLGERNPWFPDALRIFNLGDLGKVKLICSSLSLGTASYIMETKKMSSADIFEGIDLLCQICDVAATKRDKIELKTCITHRKTLSLHRRTN